MGKLQVLSLLRGVFTDFADDAPSLACASAGGLAFRRAPGWTRPGHEAGPARNRATWPVRPRPAG